MRRLFFLTAFGLALAACAEDGRAPVIGEGNPSRGRQVYLANCVACHNPDPARSGPLGPPVKGASRELLEARVVRGAYPPGYRPKQGTALMQPMPSLARAIPDLAAYLK